jgi:hypothetical protein
LADKQWKEDKENNLQEEQKDLKDPDGEKAESSNLW